MYGMGWGVMDRHTAHLVVALCVPVLDRAG